MGLLAANRLPGWLARVLCLAVVYYIAGRLALLMAIPPGYATAVWPAAGTALAGILVWGKRVWPGIVLGSFCINFPTSLESLAAAWTLKPWLVAATLGGGAALQAVAGALLVRRRVSHATLFASEIEMVKILLLAGPLACLVSATVGVSSLWIAGTISGTEAPFSWWTWWVGDTIGVLVVLPVFLTWIAPARQLSWRRKTQLALPLAALCALVVVVFGYTSALEQQRIQSEFARRAEQLTRVLTLNLAGYTEVLDAIGDLYASDADVGRAQFSKFVERSLAQRPGIQALSWNPLVGDSERGQFEAAARAEGYRDFQIIELDSAGQLPRAATRPTYFPVRYIEPYPSNARALGYDTASDPARLAALTQARDTGKATATGLITLVQDLRQPFGFLLALPVYHPGLPHATLAQRRRNLRGYAVAVFRIDQLMAAFLHGQDTEGLQIWLQDDVAPEPKRLLYRQGPGSLTGIDSVKETPLGAARLESARLEPSDGFAKVETIAVGGRRWTLQFALLPAYLQAQRSWLAWSVLAIGLLFTALLGTFLLVIAGRAGLIEETVLQRTGELRLANLALERIHKGLAENQLRLEEAQKIASVGSWEWNVQADTISWSEELYRIYGASPESFEPGYAAYLQRAHPDDREAMDEAVRRAMETHQPFAFEHRIIRPDGTIRMMQANGRVIVNDRGEVVQILGTGQDVTELKEAEQRLLQLAHFDPLTALPNRALFYQSLRDALAQAAEQDWTVSVLFLDIDHFKNVNDTLGHACGDQLLCQLGRRLVRSLRVRDTVSRFGGDEFAIILISPDNTHSATTIVADKLRSALRQPFDLEGREVTVTASIGITLFPVDATDAEVLIKYADTAMYAAKEAGRDTYRYYTAAMNDNVERRLDLDNALRRALAHDEFVLHYQPKIDIASGRWTGVEALLRWNRPGHGLVPPGEFIPILEETGLIEPVGIWVIDAACRQIATWIAAGIGPVPIAVNVSVKQLLSGRLDQEITAEGRADAAHVESSLLEQAIERALREHDIASHLLELELTESTLMLHGAKTVGLLQRLTSMGLQIAIDDFGTGYSSLAYLKRFSVSTIKIDQTFIRDISTDVDDAAITAAIISMAHSLKLRVIAEGVETAEQLEFLRAHDCDEAQGYLLARPMSGEDCAALLRGAPVRPR